MGKKRIVFRDKQGSFAHIKETLVREFPKLKTQNSAFEFMRADRGGACRPLLPIPMQTVGYTVPFLRDAVGSGIIYVRPIQCELSLDQDITPSTSSSEDAVMTQCINCNKSMPLHSLRDHMPLCNGGSSGETPTNSVGLTNVQAPVVSTDGQLQLKTIHVADTALWTEKLSLMFPKESKESLQKAVHSASTLEEAGDLLCESQEIEVVIEESTVHSDLPLAENVRSNGKEERKVVNEGIYMYCCLQRI